MPGLNVYYIFNGLLLVMSLYLFIKTTSDLMKKNVNSAFKLFIIIFCAYLVFNTIWTMQEYDVISLPKWLFKIICAMSLTLVLSNAFCFYRFLSIHFGYFKENKLRYEILGSIPYLAVALAILTSIGTNFVFSITDELNINQEIGYLLLPMCALFYFGVIIVRSAIETHRSKSPQARRISFTMIITTIFLMTWIFIDNLFDGLTIIPVAIFFVLLIIFTTFQQSSINTDALTQMNNRRKAMEYLAVQLDNVSEEAPLYVYICDINNFKMINDTFGHLEGDQAIVILANTIKEEIGKIRGFAARYGGDEFIMAIKPQSSDYDVNDIVVKINESVQTKCAEKPYIISITAGYVKCVDKKMSIEACLKEADELLYDNKEKRPRVSPIK